MMTTSISVEVESANLISLLLSASFSCFERSPASSKQDIELLVLEEWYIVLIQKCKSRSVKMKILF
jgi:hypothetical protein